MLDNFIRRWIQRPGKIVGDFLKPGDTAIDLGCGPGFFTIEMAKRVGPNGRVIAVDLQPEMLAHVARKSRKHGVSEIVTCHPCQAQDIGLSISADFILAFYMIHETPDIRTSLTQIKALMGQGARTLVVEPKMHVGKATFQTILDIAQDVGLTVLHRPSGMGGRSVLFGKDQGYSTDVS
ncbi:MAG: class I SAM-dependent methyltransferase [Desulfatitalea sp.]|nr:class I SAM-dependent methyltransferase [Desulfatitalea sp.]NNK01662.1 class I SAM-dependent methyltransferase [Desulfatitalea sp.]